jgi:hypothetical protein
MKRRSQRWLLASVLAVWALPAAAWAPETRVRMVDEAVRLMPAGLRLALEHHREAILRGLLTPMTHEDGPEHLPPWGQGSLDVAIESAAQSLTAVLSQPAPFDAIAEEFGRLAHYVADAAFPPGVSRSDGARRYAHFAEFCESRRGRFPFVFDRHDDPAVSQRAYRRFALELMEAASGDDRELARAYAAAGEPPDPAAFDDRSVPFAVGSLAYSRSITRIVRVWLGVWGQAGGDVARTPYRDPAE